MSIQIGVVDTGVNQEHQCFKKKKLTGIGVRRDADRYYYESRFCDLNGHGTAIALRIQEFCRSAQIHAVRIAQQDENGAVVRVQEQAVAMGIEWCVKQGIRIINVSYSIAEAQEEGLLARACRDAYEQGAILVAAYRNSSECAVYPAAFPTVIGVHRLPNSQPGQVAILSAKNHDLLAWGDSNSLATAQVSAMVGRMFTINSSLGLAEVFAFLTEVAIPNPYQSAV